MAARKTATKKPAHLTNAEYEELLRLSLDVLKATLLDPNATPTDKSKASGEMRQCLAALSRLANEAPPADDDPIEAIRLRVLGGTR